MSAEVLIRMEGVSVQPQAEAPAVALTGVDWELRRGEFWVVGGLNWSGKTDWLATAAGLLKPLAGRQTIFGRDHESLNSRELLAARLKIGFVFEHTGRLFTDLNVAENLALPLSYHRNCVPEDTLPDVRRMLEVCGLSELATSSPNDLSRGMRRRVALARALTVEPEILMIDSPLTSMDPVQSRWWIEFLAKLQRGESFPFKCPSTFVVTVEDYRPWLDEGRQFALLQRGRLRVLGDAAAVENSAEAQVREMMSGEI